MELTILMPCLNEAETLETCISKATVFLEKESVGRFWSRTMEAQTILRRLRDLSEQGLFMWTEKDMARHCRRGWKMPGELMSLWAMRMTVMIFST